MRPTCFSSEKRSTEDCPDFAWGFYFRPIILRLGPPVVDVILEVPAADELRDLIIEGDAFLSRVTNIFVEPTIFVLVPFGAVST